MPYKTDTQAIDNYFIDGRTKMLPCQKERCKALYTEGMSITGLGKMFHVSKRLIQFLLFPERHAKNLADREARGGTIQYYDKDKHSVTMKKHRRKKHKILGK